MSRKAENAITVPQPQLSIPALLLLIVGFWTYVSFITVMQWQLMKAVIPELHIVSTLTMALECLLLFFPLIALTLISRRIGYDQRHWRRQLPLHVALACVFGVCARPTMLFSRSYVENLVFVDLLFDHTRPLATTLRLHLSEALFDAMQYLVLQGFIAGATFYLRFSKEQELRETLTTQYERARLSALRMQINPHFLYNTLSAIAGLVRSNPQAAEGMVTRLGDLFRRALAERNTELVTLEQELEYAESYLEIQRVRFADRLTYTIRSDDSLKGVAIPPLLLQPLLENAVEHGLHETEGAVRIALICRAVESQVEIAVLNKSEGPVFPNQASHPRHGIGLNNVRDRLQAAYADESEFIFRNTSVGEYETLMRFPYQAHSPAVGAEEAA
jgi:hypothetical protein